MVHTIWKAWAPPKVTFFTWLATQKRIWTTDRLAKRGWPNCGLCPLCKREHESVDHLFFKCRFTIRLWGMLKDWLQLEHLDITTWHLKRSITDWWTGISDTTVPNRKAMASLTMLASWAIWNERNARVFHHKSTLPTILLANIKSDVKVWVKAGAKKLGIIMTGE